MLEWRVESRADAGELKPPFELLQVEGETVGQKERAPSSEELDESVCGLSRGGTDVGQRGQL